MPVCTYTRYDIIRNFPPIIFLSTLRNSYVNMATSEGGGWAGRVGITLVVTGPSVYKKNSLVDDDCPSLSCPLEGRGSGGGGGISGRSKKKREISYIYMKHYGST